MASAGHDLSVGLAQVALATVRTERDIQAGSTQDAFGEGLLGTRHRCFNVDRLANGGEDGFAVGGGHPAEVADLACLPKPGAGRWKPSGRMWARNRRVKISTGMVSVFSRLFSERLAGA